MKKIFLFAIVIFTATFVFLLSSRKVYALSDQMEIHSELLLTLPDVREVAVLAYDDNIILYNVTDQFGINKVQLLVGGKAKLTYQIKVTAFYNDMNTFYIGGISNSQVLIISVDKTTYKVKETVINADVINDIKKDVDTWVIVGSKDNDALILVVNQNFEQIRKKTYGGEGKECFKKLIISEDYYLVVGEKDADSMVNVGNVGEQKVFLSLISKDLSESKHEYLNFLESTEQIVTVIFHSDQYHLLIKAGNKYFLTCFSLQINYLYTINLNDLYNFEIKDVMLLKGYQDNLITVYKKGSSLYYGVLDGVTGKDKENYSLSIEGKVIGANISSGLLELLVLQNENLLLYQVDNYEEDIKPLIINKEYCPIDELDQIKVTSPFGEVKIERKAITPHFSNSISGDYQATFEVTLPSGRTVQKVRLIKVYPYANVVDGGIYPTNYTLDFFNYGKLNGVSIARNKKITSPGAYTLTLTNNIGEVKTINFQVVDNYLKSSADHFQDVDCTLSKGEPFTLELPFNTSGIIRSIVISGNEFQNFTTQDGKLKVMLQAPILEGVYPYLINSVKVDYEGKEVSEEVNQVVMVRVKKTLPEVNISSTKQREFLLNINDDNQTLVDLVINVYENNMLITSISSALQSKEFVINNLVPNHQYQVKLLMKYHFGDGVMKEENLLEFQTEANSSELKIGKLTIIKQQQDLEEASFTILVKERNIQKLKVANIELTPTSNPSNYQWIIAGGLMVALAITLAVFINRHNRKHVSQR